MNGNLETTLILIVSVLLAWCAVLTRIVIGHRDEFLRARKRIALGLPPFPKAPDDGRDQYLDRMGMN